MTTKTIPNGLIARTAIQCTCPDSGETGTFLFSGGSHRESGSRKSPVFRDCVALFEWCRANSWKGVGDAYIYEGQP